MVDRRAPTCKSPHSDLAASHGQKCLCGSFGIRGGGGGRWGGSCILQALPARNNSTPPPSMTTKHLPPFPPHPAQGTAAPEAPVYLCTRTLRAGRSAAPPLQGQKLDSPSGHQQKGHGEHNRKGGEHQPHTTTEGSSTEHGAIHQETCHMTTLDRDREVNKTKGKLYRIWRHTLTHGGTVKKHKDEEELQDSGYL